MTKGFALLLAAVSAGAIAVPAHAQEDHGFTGPWVAGVGGYDKNQAGSTTDNDASEDDDQSAEGLVWGGAVGYDVDLGTMVIGGEAEFTESTADTDSLDGDPENFGLGSVEAGRDIYVGARAGFKATPSTLVYAKGGYTNARYGFLGTDGTVEDEQHIDVDGWRVGAGVEQKLGSNAFAKLEYRYSNYSNGEVDFEPEGIPDTEPFDVDIDRHQVVASVGWRF
ncbi:MAG TPA: outer membrane beta-barrel protein [Croceibacterium sp.]|nr:outer membrane beta-barrel protein [Croceibacterium sp.]